MNDRPHLLFLSHTQPYPPDTGVAIRTYNILRLLARSFRVTGLCFYRRKTADSPELLDRIRSELRRLGDIEIFPIPQEHDRVRWVRDHLESALRAVVYTTPVFESAAFRQRLTELLRTQRFDIVHLESPALSGYLPLLEGVPVVMVHHNVESQLMHRRAQRERSPLHRLYLGYQARLLEREEERWCGRVALNVTVSEVDRQTLRSQIPEGRYVVVPNGVDVQACTPEPGREEGLVYVGGTNWYPNLDALDYFSQEVMPLLRAAEGEIPVRWVGRAAEEERTRFRQMGIELTGYVDDPRPYVRDAVCYVVPLRIGGGTRLKILEAWAMGKAVVSTSIGCEGLDAVDGENILIRDTPAAFAEAVRAVLHDRELRGRLGAAARATAERRYSWEVIGDAMIRRYLELIPAVRLPQHG